MAVLRVVAALLIFMGAAWAEPVVFQTKAGAIDGYDPVAYFTEGKPAKGKKEFSHSWMGANWLFASAANRDAFAAAPEKYAPQYNGYCAYGIANGYAVKIDPDAWTVENGKLYLNYSKSVRADWLKEKPGYIAKGDANWPGIKEKLK
jgi:hypothetical protein